MGLASEAAATASNLALRKARFIEAIDRIVVSPRLAATFRGSRVRRCTGPMTAA